MSATPQGATITFRGLLSGMKYAKDVYVSDVATALINWDSGAGASATSRNFWRAPEPIEMLDFSMIAGTADTTKIQVTRNGVNTGDTLRYAVNLSSLSSRPRLKILFASGDEVGATQLA